MPKKLNVGCGRDILPEWINLDYAALRGIDVVYDLERCAEIPMPFEDDSIDEFLLSHVIEHIRNSMPMMQELHRIAKPGALARIRLPHGASDDAWEDPTHVRSYFQQSFGYFSQPIIGGQIMGIEATGNRKSCIWPSAKMFMLERVWRPFQTMSRTSATWCGRWSLKCVPSSPSASRSRSCRWHHESNSFWHELIVFWRIIQRPGRSHLPLLS